MSNPQPSYRTPSPEQLSLLGRLMGWCLRNKLIVGLAVLLAVGWGIMVAPFDWRTPIERRPVPVDAIPDIGENQQIVFTSWPGRSPQDVEDQVTYPMTVSLLGVPGVRTIRGFSMFGFSTIYVIFEEGVDFYWSRSRLLEKLNSLPAGSLPAGVQPALGPDATGLGQIYWYTLEGRDPDGEPIGGWDLEELRTIQDWTVRYGLLAAQGVSDVGSVGGFVREYQVDVDPDAMRAYDVTLPEIVEAVRASNLDVGAKTIELNHVEYLIRGVGFIERVEDIAESVVKVREHVPVLVKNVGTVTLGPALRRGALDKGGAEAVGGVVVARYGDNPLAVIGNVKEKIEEISLGLPAKVIIAHGSSEETIRRYAERNGFEPYADGSTDRSPRGDSVVGPSAVELTAEASPRRELAHDRWVRHLRSLPREDRPGWANISQVTIVPFYDRTGLIYETLGTLREALTQQILITLVVVILMVLHLRSSVLIGGMLPLAVLLCFVAMKTFGVDANIVALSGIAIAIGTIVDMGIVISENILRHLDAAPPDAPRLAVIHRAASEVGSAVLTAVATTVVSFLPVFTMIGAEGKLFRPLAFTKTFALIASIVIALTVIPPAAHLVFCGRVSGRKLRAGLFGVLTAAGLGLVAYGAYLGSFAIVASGTALTLFGLYNIFQDRVPERIHRAGPLVANLIIVALVGFVLTVYWEPLGPERGTIRNLLFVGGLIAGLLLFFKLFQWVYPALLRGALAHKLLFLLIVAGVLLVGVLGFVGFERVVAPVERGLTAVGVERDSLRRTRLWAWGTETFPGLGEEFLPPLDEGSFLYMPTTMTHASIGEALDVLSKQDMALESIPEVDSAVGKIGRADTPLDPAPISMIETVITYKSEYITDESGWRVRFRYDQSAGEFVRDEDGELIPDSDGRPFRQWRDHIRSPEDIWEEIVEAAQIPGTTSAPRLQPIKARLVMLQSGMRAPMGVKVKGPSLEAIEDAGLQIERLLKEVSGVQTDAVIADRVVGKPYLHIVPDRRALARYGVKIRQFQDIVETAIGGRRVTTTVEGRERFGVRVRYQRELRDTIETMGRILVPGRDGSQIPLAEVAGIEYVRGPQAIKSEDTRLTAYVVFDKLPGEAEVDVVERCRAYLREKIASGELTLPDGVSYRFAGNYENQVRSRKTLALVLPVSLFVIFMILYVQFRAVSTTLIVFTGIFVAWAGGFIILWMYGQPWFLDFRVFGVEMRDLFQVHTINLSVAVWVGFLALFGIATDNGVIQSTYLDQVFRDRAPDRTRGIRESTLVAARRRVRPCLMTSATTILALIPVLTSTGRGSDVMVPMAIPSFGGMLLVLLSIFMVPVLYCLVREFMHHTGWSEARVGAALLLTGLLALIPMAVYCALHASPDGRTPAEPSS